MDTINFDKQLWQLYITAKKSILDKNAAEIKIKDYQLDTDNKSLSFQLFYENPLLIARKIIERYFDNVEIEERESLLQYSVSKEYDENTIRGNLKAIKEKLESLSFEVENFPIITISLISNNSFINEIEECYVEKGDYFKLPRQKIINILNKKAGFELAERVQVQLNYGYNTKSELRNYENLLLEADIKLKIKDRFLRFDFGSVAELDTKLDLLKKLPLNHPAYFNDSYTFIVKLKKNNSDLLEIKKDILGKFKWGAGVEEKKAGKKNISIQYSLDENGENRLRKFIDFAHEQAQIYNAQIEILDDTKYVFQIKYNEESARYAENQKLSLLKGADINWQDKLLGSIQKISNKKLVVRLDENLSHEFKEKLISKELFIDSVKPELRGELDKLYRLQEVVQAIDDDKKTIVNPKLREFFFDSSKATPIDESYFEPTNEKWLEVITHGQSKTLNVSQWRAVTSALYAQDIAVIQGPPGTGKSTVIAEIIWQHLFRNPQQKIILTSETHMAVDNAIERVVKNYNIVKPIRFGDDLKLENEGARFSLNRIKKWAGVFVSKYDDRGEVIEEQDENIEDNVLRMWFDNIRIRSQKHLADDKSSPLSWWHEYLQNYPAELKVILYDNYVKHVNLLGATSSSIGWKNAEGKWTKFFKQWLELYPNDAKKSHENPLKFDITIIDEASKATPPELALPLLFSKKGIIVGDHRQLPPMLDGDEFEATLELNGEQRLLREFKKYDTSKSHFEKLFLNPQLSPTLKTTFDTQFRMHPAIGSVIQQFYKEDLGESGLKCGLDPMKIEQGFDEPQSRFHGLKSSGFIQPHQHCIWVNVESPEIKEGTSRVNYGEVAAVKWVLDSIKNSEGFDDYMNYFGKADKKQEDSEIGIISFYGKQLQALQADIKNQPNLPIRISTVDRFQGMERNIVIVSLVRSNIIALDKLQAPDFESFGKLGYPNQPDLGFAKSPNRLNVALSRAKRLLIIVGNAAHFSQKEMYADVVSQITNSQSGTLINFSAVDTYER